MTVPPSLVLRAIELYKSIKYIGLTGETNTNLVPQNMSPFFTLLPWKQQLLKFLYFYKKYMWEYTFPK